MKTFLTTLAMLLFLGINNLFASHFAGSGITYTCLGGNAYEITMTFYRDCSGIAEPNTVNVSFECSTDSNYNFSATLQKIPGTGQEITPTCGLYSYCNGGNYYGIREFVYRATVTLLPCNSWHMSYSSCCRNPITTTATSGGWYVEATLNNLQAPCNSSPHFTNKPVAIVCNNQNINYNPGAADADGDSLVYSFFAPKRTSNYSVLYYPQFSDTNFLSSSTPITLNHSSGNINFTPNQELTTITGIKVEEWRNINGSPTMIGFITRDIQLKVVNCGANSTPVLSGIDLQKHAGYSSTDTNYYMVHHTNYGDVDFFIHGYDADSVTAANPDNGRFTITWNQGIYSGLFTVQNDGTDSAYAHFFWDYSYFSNSPSPIPYCFTATVKDLSCPFSAQQTFTYCIKIATPNTSLGNTPDKPAQISVYPVPVSDVLHFKVAKGQRPVFLQIFDIQGNKLAEKKMDSDNEMKVEGLPAGAYFYRLFTEERVFNGKFVKK